MWFNRVKSKLQKEFGSWYTHLEPYISTKGFEYLMKYIALEYKQYGIAPKVENLFRIYRLIPPEDVNVIIIGQEPYTHTKNGQMVANGIGFGTDIIKYIPDNLNNIYKEILRAYNKPEIPPYLVFKDSSLQYLIKQGVMLINTSFTSRVGFPRHHIDITYKGQLVSWTDLILNTIKIVQSYNPFLIIMVMGSEANALCERIDTSQTKIISTSHPTSKAFMNSTYQPSLWESNFNIKINRHLKRNNLPIIRWINK